MDRNWPVSAGKGNVFAELSRIMCVLGTQASALVCLGMVVAVVAVCWNADMNKVQKRRKEEHFCRGTV